MRRVYRLSKIGAKLPFRHLYGPAPSPDACDPGFEAFKGPIYSIANTIGPAPGSPGEGDFTPSVGYNLMLLIDVRMARSHKWNWETWVVISCEDVASLRSLAVAELHSWLRANPLCLDAAGQLSRERVVEWVTSNKNAVEKWLEEHSQIHPVAFVETIVSVPASSSP